MLCCAVLCCAVLCCAVLCCAVLCCARSRLGRHRPGALPGLQGELVEVPCASGSSPTNPGARLAAVILGQADRQASGGAPSPLRPGYWGSLDEGDAQAAAAAVEVLLLVGRHEEALR